MLRPCIFHNTRDGLIDFIVKTLEQFLADAFDYALNLRVISVVLIIAFVPVISQGVIQFARAAPAQLMGEIFLYRRLSWNGCCFLFLLLLGFLNLDGFLDCGYVL